MTAATHHGAPPGLVTASSVCLATVAAVALHMDNPWWAAISVWMVANPDVQALWLKGMMRIAGTLLGCAVGYVAAIAAIDNIGLQAALLFLFGYLMTLLRFTTGYSYAWLFFMLIPALLVYVAASDPGGIRDFAVWRAAEIVIGVVAALLTAGLFTALFGSATARRSLRDAYLRTRPRLGPRERVEVHALAAAGGTVAVLIALLWAVLDLPALTQIGISVLACLDRDPGGSQVRGWQRLLGVSAGGLLGLAMVALGVDLFLFWLALLFLGIYLFSGLHHFGGDRAYIGTQGGIGFMMCLVTGSGPPHSILLVVDRFAGILCGVLLLVAVLACLQLALRWLLPPLPAAAGEGG